MGWVEEEDLPDLPAIFQALSLNSEALEAVRDLNEALAFGNSTLGRVNEEAIATVVAVANRCRYGAVTHAGFFHRHSGDSDQARQLLLDYTQADFPPMERRMLDFAVRLTLEPASLTENDVVELRDAGFADEDIVSIVLVSCLFNFMDRVASSLGVEVPPSLQRMVERWFTEPTAQQAWLLDSVVEQVQRPSDEGRVLPDDPGGAAVESGDEPPPGPEEALPEEAPPVEPPPVVPPTVEAPPVSAPPDVAPPVEPPPVVAPPVEPPLVKAPPVASPPVTAPPVEPPPVVAPPVVAPPVEPPPVESLLEETGQPPQEPVMPHTVERFVEECCVASPDQSATARDLYVAYNRWCDENRAAALLQGSFGRGLSELEFTRRRRGHGRHWWLGIGLEGADT